MKISFFKKNHKFRLIIIFFCIVSLIGIFSFWQVLAIPNFSNGIINWNPIVEKKYIKWFEFNVSYDVLDKTSKLDINSHVKNEDVKFNWIELISYLACKYGNDFSKFKQKDLDSLLQKLRNGQTMTELTTDMKNYSYYFEGYDSVLHEFIGEYEIGTNEYNKKYGIKAFHPLAKGFSYSHYDDFGASRSYGYKRLHFGNDLMGSIGTPVIALESGIVEALRMESVWWLENWYS